MQTSAMHCKMYLWETDILVSNILPNILFTKGLFEQHISLSILFRSTDTSLSDVISICCIFPSYKLAHTFLYNSKFFVLFSSKLLFFCKKNFQIASLWGQIMFAVNGNSQVVLLSKL